MDKDCDERTAWYWKRLYVVGVPTGIKEGEVNRHYMTALPHMMESLSIVTNGYPDFDDYLWFKLSTLRYLVASTENVLSCIGMV